MTSDVVFFESDASFKDNMTAIIAVKDKFTERTYQKIVKTENSIDAEKQAIIFAIDIAIVNGYKHVVFIYDCQALNVDILKKRYEKNFGSLQFLWLKRKYIAAVDKITKTKETEELRNIRGLTEDERDKKVFETLSPFVNTMEEIAIFKKQVLRGYRITSDNKRVVFLNFVYYLLSKNGKKKIKRDLKTYFSREELGQIYKVKRNAEYRGLLKQLKINNLFIQELILFNGQKRKKIRNF